MKFSVLISLYDKEQPEYLDMALESILVNQMLKPDEVVLVEDGPINQELKEILEKYKKLFKSLKVVSLEKNMGLGLALQKGIKECSQEFIFRMDTDDVSHPERFKYQVEYLKKNPEVKIIGANAVDFDKNINNVKNLRIFPETNENILKFSKRRCPFLHPTIGFYKDIVLEVGNYRDLLFFEDYDLFLRILNKYKGYNLQKNLLYFRSNEGVFKRRGGFNYLKLEYKALKIFNKEKLMNNYYFLTNLIIRFGFRICGNNIRSILYKKILRK